jgi:hypothetical protein
MGGLLKFGSERHKQTSSMFVFQNSNDFFMKQTGEETAARKRRISG